MLAELAFFSYLFTSALSHSYDPREATISSTHHALYTGVTTCREVVSSFFSRIEALNFHTNAIISLDPHALQIADQYDIQLQANNSSYGLLFCIPTLLKDNYDTVDLPTTGGSLDLRYSQPSKDAPSVTALRQAGAIILGKANLHELALEGLSVSSLGGQTINPYDKTRTPGGSSGGTGAAIAASFAVWGTGTDTVNSLRSPASANSLFSVRPTRGLISRTGVIPISYTQDAIGPIARCVEDLAVALTVMSGVGYDAEDNTTALIPAGVKGTDYTAGLKKTETLEGMRFGLVEGFFNRTPSLENDPINEAMQRTVARLHTAGATVINITDTMFDSDSILKRFDTQRYEFRESMDAYLQRKELGGEHPDTLNELYDSGNFRRNPFAIRIRQHRPRLLNIKHHWPPGKLRGRQRRDRQSHTSSSPHLQDRASRRFDLPRTEKPRGADWLSVAKREKRDPCCIDGLAGCNGACRV